MQATDLEALICPDCRGNLGFRPAPSPAPEPSGALVCAGCDGSWKVRDGRARMYRESWVSGPDRLLRIIYDAAPRLHDPAVRYLLPVWQIGGTERQMREAYLRRLELHALVRPPDGRPLRILEVGVGAGANIPLILGRLATAGPVQYWGLDLSAGMLSVCERRVRRRGEGRARLLLGDAHALPFADGWFDRVFHVGGMGGFRDPARALAEMARVAVAESPIVVVDEQLDPAARANLWKRFWFEVITFYDDDPRSPTQDLPPGAIDVLEEQMSAFYYCLRFRMPRGQGARA